MHTKETDELGLTTDYYFQINRNKIFLDHHIMITYGLVHFRWLCAPATAPTSRTGEAVLAACPPGVEPGPRGSHPGPQSHRDPACNYRPAPRPSPGRDGYPDHG